MKLSTLIVTNGNKELDTCIEGILAQSITTNIYICDTGYYSESELNYLKKKYNICILPSIYNKSKAYSNSLNYLYSKKYDFVWVIDQNIITNNDTLEKMIPADIDLTKISFITSIIHDKNGKNFYVPSISQFVNSNNVRGYLDEINKNFIRISTGSLLSTLINLKTQSVSTRNTISSEYDSKYLSELVAKFGAGYISTKSITTYNGSHQAAKNTNDLKKVCTIIVTYNRLKLLKESLNAIFEQNYNSDVIVVNNGSTDGTTDYLNALDKITHINTGSNLGGSGGFYVGLKYAALHEYDYAWIMDDDVIPEKNALSELISHLKYTKKISFLASSVYSINNDAMNTPEISTYSTNGYRFWYDKLEYGMIRLKHATFVSLLINCDAIRTCGLPCKDYFIWGDDTEYTMRIIGKYAAAYMVGSSKVTHKRALTKSLDIVSETDEGRISMYYYLIRNTLINTSAYGKQTEIKNVYMDYKNKIHTIKHNNDPLKNKKIETIQKALKDYKKEEYNKKIFERRYSFYGQEDLILSVVGISKLTLIHPYITVNNTITNTLHELFSFLQTNHTLNLDQPLDKNELMIINLEKSTVEYEQLYGNNIESIKEELISILYELKKQYKLDKIIIQSPKKVTNYYLMVENIVIDLLPGIKKINNFSNINDEIDNLKNIYLND